MAEKKRGFVRGVPSTTRLALYAFAGVILGTASNEYRKFLNEFGGHARPADVRRSEELLAQIEPLYRKAGDAVSGYYRKESEILKPITARIGTEPWLSRYIDAFEKYEWRDRQGRYQVTSGEAYSKAHQKWMGEFQTELKKNPEIARLHEQLQKTAPPIFARWHRLMEPHIRRDNELSDAKFSAQKRAEGQKVFRNKVARSVAINASAAYLLGAGAFAGARLVKRPRGLTRPPNRPRRR